MLDDICTEGTVLKGTVGYEHETAVNVSISNPSVMGPYRMKKSDHR